MAIATHDSQDSDRTDCDAYNRNPRQEWQNVNPQLKVINDTGYLIDAA